MSFFEGEGRYPSQVSRHAQGRNGRYSHPSRKHGMKRREKQIIRDDPGLCAFFADEA